MPLTAGSRLGRYEIVAPLGAGGMGEVYRARDTQLARSVALKVLRFDLAGDDGLRARFRREAEAIAALKHPHVCVLYDVARHDDLDFLVMEHLEGETLSSRLRRGPLPIDQVLQHGIELASALEAAHRQGFVHRDLKPGNVMLTAAGAKVLDFGLAKPLGVESASAESVEITRTQPLTARGAVLGTLGYMPPEQLEGRPVDARSDLFALGAILWEMATGRRAFDASSQAGLIATILTGGPPRREPTDPALPPLFDRIVAKCLAKDPDRRWQSATDLGDALRWVSDATLEPRSDHGPARGPRRVWLVAGAAAAALLALVLLVAPALLRRPAAAPATAPLRLSVVPPPGTTLAPRDVTGHAQFALSPDGSRLAFVAVRPGEPAQIWVRSLASGGAIPLPGTEEANGPFWSPDGENLAFVARGRLKRIAVNGAVVRELAEVSADVGSGSWSRDGTILYSGGAGEGLFRIPADGGEARLATSLDKSRQEIGHRSPQFLPDGRRFLLYVGSTRPEWSGVHLGSLDSTVTTQVLRSAANGVYAAPGYLLFDQGSQLTAQRLDLESGALLGEATSLGDRVVGIFGPSFLPVSAADNGTLAYWNGKPPPTELRWLDRDGRPSGNVELSGLILNPRLSPDGAQLVVTLRDPVGESDIWRVDLASGVASRVTFSGTARFALWSPDGESLVYGDKLALYRRAASGAGEETVVLAPSGHWAIFPEDWSSDGRWLVCIAAVRTGWEVATIDMSAGELQPIREAPGSQIHPRLSPDGRWLAYTSDETGAWEVYVQQFPDGRGRWQVSSGGGAQPQWRADGGELYYLDGEGFMVAVAADGSGDAFRAGPAERRFATRQGPILAPYRGTYAVTPDGQRFLVDTLLTDADPSIITVVLDWPAALQRAIDESAR